ncbi:ATP-grasp domain-containing protein [Candidatus Saccharibacteria bacterium]|nr:MAG: ATP-grasp domain-containing protein [Candidatus Saccharibacteria bacterium]
MVKHKLAIDYNVNQPIGVISADPYNFLVLDRLFDDFQIVTPRKQDWLKDIPLRGRTVSMNLKNAFLGENISKYVIVKKFVEMFKADPRRKYPLYSPLDPPYKINPLAFLMNSPTIAHAYENKRYFRDEFADLIRIPDYEIKYMNELDRAASYRDLRDRFAGAFMLQDEESSGSKGTYAIHNENDYVDAVKSLKKFSQGRTVVASQFIHGEISSIQVCITKYGIFSGGIQRQLVDSKYLCNTKIEGVTRWCGGEIGADYPDIVQHRAQEIASVIGSELSSHGYKGVFGVDLIVTPDDEVYAIEINARLTGYSHIISDMQMMNDKIPFMLLHVLELGNFRYEVTGNDALPSAARYKKPGSLLILNNQSDEDIILKKHIRPGVYKLVGNRVEFVKEGYSLKDARAEDTMLIFCRHNEGEIIGKGKRILKIMKLGKTIAKGDLNLKTQQLVQAIKETFELPG